MGGEKKGREDEKQDTNKNGDTSKLPRKVGKMQRGERNQRMNKNKVGAHGEREEGEGRRVSIASYKIKQWAKEKGGEGANR